MNTENTVLPIENPVQNQASAEKPAEPTEPAEKAEDTKNIKKADAPQNNPLRKKRGIPHTQTRWAHFTLCLFIPLIMLVLCEWNYRGSLLDGFFESIYYYTESFVLAYLFLLFIYLFISHLFRRHWPAVLVTGLTAIVPGVVSYYKTTMRGEPFLPWDLSQIKDLMGVAGNVKFTIQPGIIITAVIFVLLLGLGVFVRFPYKKQRWRIGGAAAGGVLLCGLIFGVYLRSAATLALGIQPNYWRQDKYYLCNGVITGFMTNLQCLQIEKPEDYSKETVLQIAEETEKAAKRAPVLYEGCYADVTPKSEIQKQPNIIYVMNESFYDVTRFDGITYNEPLTPNFTALRQSAAYGYCFSPSFGGGTCDVEFEAITGYSVSHLPSGVKPYQQHVTHDMFSLPQYLKSRGYATMAIHGYYGRMWSRNTAYPNLGIDTYYAREEFVSPKMLRGFVSDEEMTDRIISEFENRDPNKPIFIHAVTMQNHTTYDETRYYPDHMVDITSYPSGMSDLTRGKLRDFATGVRDADAALGALIDYFSQCDEPVIVVFWGDHMNPIGTGENPYELFTSTGYIQPGEDSSSPELHKTDMLIWSNYYNQPIDLGTVASYNITPVMMDLYGLDMPLMFAYNKQEMQVMRARTLGITINPDGSYSDDMTEEQQKFYDRQWVLQYDYMFGEPYTEDYVTKK